jgi:putative ATP-binding cassette transporter
VDKAKRRVLRDAWKLANPYWTSDEKWSAWGLLLAVVALNLGNVYISVRINEWNNAFYNALQAFNGGEFFRQLGIFCMLAALFIGMSVYALYLTQMLRVRWRRWRQTPSAKRRTTGRSPGNAVIADNAGN